MLQQKVKILKGPSSTKYVSNFAYKTTHEQRRKQICIPVGCVPSSAVAVGGWGRCVCVEGCVQGGVRGCVQGVCVYPGCVCV